MTEAHARTPQGTATGDAARDTGSGEAVLALVTDQPLDAAALESWAATAADGGCALVLANGLLSRTFAVPGPGCPAPNWVTVDLADTTDPDMPPKSALAALDVEASVELAVGGVAQRWDVGGLNQTCQRWLRRQVRKTPSCPNSWSNFELFRLL